MTEKELFQWSEDNEHPIGGGLRENRNFQLKKPHYRATITTKAQPTRVKKTGKETMQNMEARYPQQGKLRRDPTYNTEPSKISCFLVVVVVAVVVLRP